MSGNTFEEILDVAHMLTSIWHGRPRLYFLPLLPCTCCDGGNRKGHRSPVETSSGSPSVAPSCQGDEGVEGSGGEGSRAPYLDRAARDDGVEQIWWERGTTAGREGGGEGRREGRVRAEAAGLFYNF
ncbi:unnamed protein product [Urochloa humidicola]